MLYANEESLKAGARPLVHLQHFDCAQEWRAMLEAIPQMVWSVAGDGSDEYYNRQWLDFAGVAVGEPHGVTRLSLVHPNDQERSRAVWQQSLKSGEPYEAEYRLRHHTGEYRWILSRGCPKRDPQGRITGWYGTCTDIHERMLAREALEESEKRVKTILDSVPQIIWSAGPDGRLNYVSDQWTGMGSAEELALGDNWVNAIHAEDRQRAQEAWRRCVATGQFYEVELRVLAPGGGHRWTLIRAQPARSPAGQIVQWYGTCTDIHERILAQEALKTSESLNRGMIEASPDCVALLDCRGVVMFVNKAALAAAGATDSSSLIGTRWWQGFDAGVRRRARSAVTAAQAGMIGRFQVAAGAADRRWWDVVVAPVCREVGEPVNLVAISRDVTHQKTAEEKARWAADHDALTQLPNRLLLQQRIDDSIREAATTGGHFAVLLLDVDHFKRINDMLGHDAGDSLLCTFADRLREACRTDDMIARLGGDEFAILLPHVRDEDQVFAAVEAILARLREPCIHDGRVLDCHASIGASIYPHQGKSRAELLKNADVALYAAKAAGRANLKLFKPEMRMELQKRASMLNLARDALQQDRITPFYQPKVDLRTGRIAGFEALLRWRDHSGRVHLPDTVAAAFDDVNLAAEISDRMIGHVIEDLQRWRDAEVAFEHVAVNAAAAEFRRGDFAERLLERLRSADLPAASLQIEVTETVFLGRGADYVERALKLLSGAGVKIALDDFGTGYASLSHLKQFPVDIIKIDRSFVRDLEGDPEDAAIIDAVIQLGRSLGIKVTAEGIETEAQHDLLCAKGCDYGQGFLYGRAIPFDEVAPLVRRVTFASQ